MGLRLGPGGRKRKVETSPKKSDLLRPFYALTPLSPTSASQGIYFVLCVIRLSEFTQASSDTALQVHGVSHLGRMSSRLQVVSLCCERFMAGKRIARWFRSTANKVIVLHVQSPEVGWHLFTIEAFPIRTCSAYPTQGCISR